MNNIFKKAGNIVLEENWSLKTDGGSGVNLVFSEIRQRKNSKTEKLEDFEFKDNWYFPKLSQALQEYFKQKTNESTDLNSLIDKVENIESILERFETKYKNW